MNVILNFGFIVFRIKVGDAQGVAVQLYLRYNLMIYVRKCKN